MQLYTKTIIKPYFSLGAEQNTIYLLMIEE